MSDAESSSESNKTPFSLFSRIWRDYPVLSTTANVAGSYYKTLKGYNSYSKRVLETAENYALPIAQASLEKLDDYIHKPLVEGVLSKVDAFGNHQLDKIEGGYLRIKEVGPKTVHTVGNALHGTRVEGVLIKTVVILDSVVDVLFPDTSDTQDEDSASAEKSSDGATRDGQDEKASLIDVTTPVYRKIKSRISKESLRKVPTHTYEGVKSLANRNIEKVPHLSHSVHLIQSTSNYLLNITHITAQKVQA